MTDPELAIASSSLEERRRAAAAYKLQRWDTAKWGTGLNASLAAGSVAFESPFLLAFAAAIAVGSWFVVLHYDRRVLGAYRDADDVVQWLTSKGYGREAALPIGPDVSAPNHDRRELLMFAAMLAFSPAFAFLQWLL
jgi:hypothetical protein